MTKNLPFPTAQEGSVEVVPGHITTICTDLLWPLPYEIILELNIIQQSH